MSERFNPISTSGIGFHLEHYIQAAYLVSLVIKTPLPLTSGTLYVRELSFQAKHLANTDDLVVRCDKDGHEETYYIQSKKGFEVGKNQTFTDVIAAAYADFQQPHFNKDVDKIIITTDSLSNSDRDDALPMLDWARWSADEAGFLLKLNGNKKKQAKFRQFKSALQVANPTIDDITAWKLLTRIYIQEYDFLFTGSRDLGMLQWYIQPHLKTGVLAKDAINSILEYAVRCNQHAADVTIANFSSEVKELFTLNSASFISDDLQLLMTNSKRQVASTIFSGIGGYHLSRERYLLEISEAVNRHKFVFLVGTGGVGKSSLVKDFVTSKPELGYLYFKADTLDKPSLAEALTSVGVKSSLEAICAQWQVFTRLVIFIDSFEKLYESEHKDALLELVQKVRELPNVTFIATCRTYALETLRKKYNIARTEVADIPIENLSGEELKIISNEKPALRGLIANPKLQNLVAIPFYLSMAMRFGDMSGKETIDERDFKSLLWEEIIERRGHGKTGESKRRGNEFTRIVIKRAKDKVPFASADGLDVGILEQLHQEDLLLKHPALDLYAPSHDLIEDLVVSRYLYHEYELKQNMITFIESLNLTPVLRRGLRFWVQDLNVTNPQEGRKLLHEVLHAQNKGAVADEFLLGIISSVDCLALLNAEKEVLLQDDAALFGRLFHLAKLAFSVEYNGNQPIRQSKSIGPVWNALMTFWYENIDAHPSLQRFQEALLTYWCLQFEAGDKIPEVGRQVGETCFGELKRVGNSYGFNAAENFLEMLFIVVPVYEKKVENFLKYTYNIKASNSENDDQHGLKIHFYRHLFEMILKKPYRCENLYKFFPSLVINLAKLEWPSERKRDWDSDMHYREQSFGLRDHPYDYFSPSANQTPFKYLFKYHFDAALDLLIWLCNRALPFYKASRYADDLITVEIRLQDGTTAIQEGNAALWASYRGEGNTPYLIQSALMAFEIALFELVSEGEDLARIFKKSLRESKTVLLTGVFASVAVAHPHALGQEVLTMISQRAFFRWDLNRYSHEMTEMHHTTIGSEYYYTHERSVSNKLSHRKNHLENLVAILQLYNPGVINSIIDEFKEKASPEDELWRLALLRMDLRNTTPHANEEESRIEFIPKPLPQHFQERLDEYEQSREDETSSIRVFLWASKALDGSGDVLPTYEDWKHHFSEYQQIDFANVSMPTDSQLNLAAVPVKFFPELLTDNEAQFCVGTLMSHFRNTVTFIKAGNGYASLDVMAKGVYTVLPRLLHDAFAEKVDRTEVKSIITDLLILHSHNEPQLIEGIRYYLWAIDADFADYCFKVALNNAYHNSVSHSAHIRMANGGENYTDAVNSLLTERKSLIEGDVLIDLASGDKQVIMEAFYMIPYNSLATTHFKYWSEVVLSIPKLIKHDDYEDYEFKGRFERLSAHLLIHAHNENTRAFLWELLNMFTSRTQMVVSVFEWFVAIAHDSKYPANTWKVFNDVLYYIAKEVPRVGFIRFVLFSHLKYPLTGNLLPYTDDIKDFYKRVISHSASDANVIDAVFQLLAGIGRAYQIESLMWLNSSLPDKASFEVALEKVTDLTYMDEYVQQMFNSHMADIKRDRERLEYFIVILDALIDKGSKVAFRLRDVVV